MPFPATQRVLYRKNPLDQVICQLRFPPILRIETAVPADFQDLIRSQYSDFAEATELKFDLPSEIREQLPGEIIRQFVQSPSGKNYHFVSEDGAWKVNLTRVFLALSTSKYERWEFFKDKLAGPLRALVDVYAPENFSRIGLRYVDVICRSKLGLTDVPWRELLASHLIGLLGSPDVATQVKNCESSYEVGLEDGVSRVRIVTGFVKSKSDSEVCYRIDSDFFTTEKTPIGEVIRQLDYFNTRSSRLIRWCVSERLHNAMEPQAL